jgi:membrane-associated protein
MDAFVDLCLHIDRHLAQMVTVRGPWVYALLFAIVFAETGLVVTPFLPGDSLLFAAGALAAAGLLDPTTVVAVLISAAIVGDAVNYAVGRTVGPWVFSASGGATWHARALNREHLARAHAFFERYGGKAVVLGRFVPIVRTFVPFVAGAGSMTYSRFASFNVTGAIVWVGICAGGGYAFGNIPIIRDNFPLVALGIVAVSLLPVAVEALRERSRRYRERVEVAD